MTDISMKAWVSDTSSGRSFFLPIKHTTINKRVLNKWDVLMALPEQAPVPLQPVTLTFNVLAIVNHEQIAECFDVDTSYQITVEGDSLTFIQNNVYFEANDKEVTIEFDNLQRWVFAISGKIVRADLYLEDGRLSYHARTKNSLQRFNLDEDLVPTRQRDLALIANGKKKASAFWTKYRKTRPLVLNAVYHFLHMKETVPQ